MANRLSQAEWRRFFTVTAVIISPVVIIFVALEIIAWRYGETWPMSRVATWQNEAPDREWRGGDGQSYLTYKVSRVRLRRPEILVLGASRANGFEETQFKPYSFYNAGLTSWTFGHYRRFLELTTNTDYVPRILIVNVDFWMFGFGFEKYWKKRFYETPTTHIADIKIVLDEIIRRPIIIWQNLVNTKQFKGLYAVLSASGFRTDGSLMFGKLKLSPDRLSSDGTSVGVAPVELSDSFDPYQVRAFEHFMAAAKSRGIAVIGIQLPYYDKILDALETTARNGSWREFRSKERAQYFADQGLIFFDFADIPSLRNTPERFVDSIHPDRVAVSKLVKRIAKDPRVQQLLPRLTSENE